MKKLMIAAAIVCAAAFAQAATYTWSSGSILYTWDSAEDQGWPVMDGCAAYLVFADAYSQSDLVDDFAGAGANITKLEAAGAGVVASDGTIADTAAISSYTADMPVYFAVLSADKETLFISGEITAAYDSLMESPVAFGDDEVAAFWTGETPYDAAAGYVGAGYYAVPEPTTGLLLLLGMAGLALKRKRA